MVTKNPLKIKDKVKYLLAGNETWIESEIVSRGGKLTGKQHLWFNVRDKGEEQLKSLNFASDQIEWEHVTESIHGDSLSSNVEEVNISIPNQYQENHSIRTAEDKELENWRNFGVYEEVTYCGQRTVSTRWVITEKVADSQIILKPRLVARGFEEDYEIQADSPTARKET